MSNGLDQKMHISARLAQIIGSRPMTRGQVMKRIWQYIKRQRLQDPRDGRIIHLDTRMRRLFGTQRRTIGMFQMTRALQRHLRPARRTTPR